MSSVDLAVLGMTAVISAILVLPQIIWWVMSIRRLSRIADALEYANWNKQS